MSCLSLWYNDWPLSRTFDSPASDWTYHPTVCFDTWLCAWTRSFTTSASRVAPLYIKTAEALPATSSDMTHVRRHWPQQWLNPLWWQKRLSVYLHRNSLLACPSAVCCAPGSLKWRRLSSDAASCQEIVTKGGHIASTCCCRHMGRIRCRVFDQSFSFLSFFVQPQQQQRLDVQLHWGFGVWWFLIQSVGRSKPSIGWSEDLNCSTDLSLHWALTNPPHRCVQPCFVSHFGFYSYVCTLTGYTFKIRCRSRIHPRKRPETELYIEKKTLWRILSGAIPVL